MSELGADGKPVLFVYNKCDAEGAAFPREGRDNTVCVSAKTGAGLEELVGRLEELVLDGKSEEIFIIPNAKQGILSKMYGFMTVNSVDYGPEEVTVSATADSKAKGMFAEFLKNKPERTKEDWE